MKLHVYYVVASDYSELKPGLVFFTEEPIQDGFGRPIIRKGAIGTLEFFEKNFETFEVEVRRATIRYIGMIDFVDDEALLIEALKALCREVRA